MRTLLVLLAAVLAAPFAQAQGSVVLAETGDALPTDAVIVVAVETASLPDGLLESLPAIPEGAERVALEDVRVEGAPLGYALPAETLAALPSEKDEDLALVFSILLTGGGHLYSGETSKGITLLAIGLGAVVGGAVLTNATDSIAPYLIGATISLGAWIYGISDAKASVRRQNALNGFALVPAPVEADGHVGAGLSLRARF